MGLPRSFRSDLAAAFEAQDFGQGAKISALVAASYLNEPISKAREYYYSLFIPLSAKESFSERWSRTGFLTTGIALSCAAAPFTAPLGALLRAAVASLEEEPFIYLKRRGQPKTLPKDRRIKLVSFNMCLMPGGYSISDAQISPPSDRQRLDELLAMVLAEDPDLICLNEVADICDANYLSARLPAYPYVIPVAGVRGIGLSSMMYVASKFPLANIEFTPFDKEAEVTGRAQYIEKGFLSFDLQNSIELEPFASVIVTHLQHSEIPDKPNVEEKKSRFAELQRIAEKAKEKIALQRSVIVTGDMNATEEELEQFLKTEPGLLQRDSRISGVPTWGGDGWSKALLDGPSSQPQVLDYTFIGGEAKKIRTQIISANFVSDRFGGFSDHSMLVSEIVVGKET